MVFKLVPSKRKMIKLLEILKEAKEAFEDFATTRGKGAEKIATTAKEKGGLAMLTYNHFIVKLPYYQKAAEGKLKIEKAKEEYNKLLEKLYKATKEGKMDIGQTEFQKIVGKIEVLGELIIEDK